MTLPTDRPNTTLPMYKRCGLIRQHQHQAQAQRLRCEAGGRGDALVQPVDHRREGEPSRRRRDRGRRDGDAGAVAAEMRQQERHLVHDEADLRRERQCERQRDGPEVQAAQRLRLAGDTR